MSYYLKKGSREIGPLEAENIVALLQAGDCLPTDLIRQEENPESWVPASTLFPEGSWTRQDVEPTLVGSSNPLAVTIRQLMNEDQDENISRKLVAALSSKLERGERVHAVSVQKNPVINLLTDAIVATSERLLIVRDLIVGRNIEAIAYEDLVSISAQKELLGAVVSVETSDKRIWAIRSLPKESAEKVVRWARARKEQLSIEPLDPPEPADPLARLKKLKELMEQGIISEADYEAKKREILPLI
jgi:hypothetical protein